MDGFYVIAQVWLALAPAGWFILLRSVVGWPWCGRVCILSVQQTNAAPSTSNPKLPRLEVWTLSPKFWSFVAGSRVLTVLNLLEVRFRVQALRALV